MNVSETNYARQPSIEHIFDNARVWVREALKKPEQNPDTDFPRLKDMFVRQYSDAAPEASSDEAENEFLALVSEEVGAQVFPELYERILPLYDAGDQDAVRREMRLAFEAAIAEIPSADDKLSCMLKLEAAFARYRNSRMMREAVDNNYFEPKKQNKAGEKSAAVQSENTNNLEKIRMWDIPSIDVLQPGRVMQLKEKGSGKIISYEILSATRQDEKGGRFIEVQDLDKGGAKEQIYSAALAALGLEPREDGLWSDYYVPVLLADKETGEIVWEPAAEQGKSGDSNDSAAIEAMMKLPKRDVPLEMIVPGLVIEVKDLEKATILKYEVITHPFVVGGLYFIKAKRQPDGYSELMQLESIGIFAQNKPRAVIATRYPVNFYIK
jgi:hypothetical protein